MTSYSQPKTAADVVLAESATSLSREPGIIPANTATAIAVGQVLGRQKIGAVASAAKSGGNTGNGTVTLDATTPALKGAKVGVYQVRFTGATTFVVLDPDGAQIGYGGATGSTWSNQLKFSIAAGGTAFVAGDGFDLTVSAGTGKLVPISTTAVDGSHLPDAVALDAVDANPSTDVKIAVISRDAVLDSAGLVWGTLTAPQQAAAIEAFRSAGIRVRTAL